MTDPTTDLDRATDAGAPAAPTRRTVLRGAMLAGAAVPFLAACGSDDSTGGTDTSSGSGSDFPLATSKVPEGGGVILDAEKVVITQPAAGEFKAFTAVCTHQGCIVDNVSDGTINCACHGSMYSIKDGSVVGGPAPEPLSPAKIAVKGEDISLA